ncbi:hypothetical protein GJ631_13965 [Natronomonas sp. CBA1123]|uniref:hypothetical protein n=1 Tax=Natronomonas sp. CBA1123 TaxID=2668070 RepID=UPI0012EA754F|nr:hypothetical protein [Natronomonas sp. CBA1123]MUV87634.1 hypothetical protein [Natronomonas sp. CBA1123]
MSLADSAVRMYLFYAFATIGFVSIGAILGTFLPGGVALFVGFLVLLVVVLGGLFWYARF